MVSHHLNQFGTHRCSRNHMFKGLCDVTGEVPHGKSPPCNVWLSLVRWKWRHNVFNLSGALTRARDLRAIRLYGGELHIACYHPGKCDGHQCNCDSGDKIFNLSHYIAIPRDARIFIGGSSLPPSQVRQILEIHLMLTQRHKNSDYSNVFHTSTFRECTHAPRTTINETYEKASVSSFKTTDKKNKKKI